MLTVLFVLFVLTSIFLILVIFVRVPEESLGLAEPSSLSQQGFNILTGVGVLLYFAIAIAIAIAIKLNFGNL